MVGIMFRAGVPLLAGTDVMNPYCLPGFSLHDELALLVESGLTPLAALQAATLRPAEFLGRTSIDSRGFTMSRKSEPTGGKANASVEDRQSPSMLPLFHC
jgi:hypothetical protein